MTGAAEPAAAGSWDVRASRSCWSAAVVALAPWPRSRRPRPESDADAAITRHGTPAVATPVRWAPRTAASIRSAPASARTSPAGKIFFTPATGAHIMQGAILDKYLALGGPADGDLGFPNIDEGAGRAPDSRNTTFSAADNPVIFLTPDTGARVVRGADQRRLGQAGRVRGSARRARPTTRSTAATWCRRNSPAAQLSWTPKTKTFTTDTARAGRPTHGLDDPGRRDVGDQRGATCRGRAARPLGAAQGAPYSVGADGLGAGLRRRQDLLQPRHRRQRRHRPGAGQVRERRRPDGRPGLPDRQRGRRRPRAEPAG